MEPEKRKAGRPPRRKPNEKLGNSIKIEDEAARILEVQAKKLKVAKGKFASAAIAYCVQAGINPLDEQATSLGSLSQQMKDGFALLGVAVTDGVANVRIHNADIGNRLYAIVRNFEKTLYAFQHQQQLTTYSYMESIESNLLRHLVAIDSDVFQPLFEHLFRTEQEAFITRSMAARIYLKLIDKPTLLNEQNAKFNEEREEVVVSRLREFIKDHKLATPHSNSKPGATPVPTKPTAPAPASPPAPPKL